MRTMLADFVSYSGFSPARIVNSKAETYITTEASMPALSSGQRNYVAKVIKNGMMMYAPLELHPKGLTLDMYIPIMPPPYRQQSNKPVAVLLLSQLADGKLS